MYGFDASKGRRRVGIRDACSKQGGGFLSRWDRRNVTRFGSIDHTNFLMQVPALACEGFPYAKLFAEFLCSTESRFSVPTAMIASRARAPAQSRIAPATAERGTEGVLDGGKAGVRLLGSGHVLMRPLPASAQEPAKRPWWDCSVRR